MYINQRDITGMEEKGCGIACVCIILGITGKEYDVEKIVREFFKMNGYVEGIGARHTTLARMLANRNIPAYAQEFTSPNDDRTLFALGLKKLQTQVRKGNPVIVSVMRHFKPDAASTHLVVISGITETAFIIQDPDYDGGGQDISVPFELFTQVWRGFTIFAEIGDTLK